MKFKTKLSAITMSLALLAVSFLSVASQKMEVNAATVESAKTVETRLKDEQSNAKGSEDNNKIATVYVKNSSEGVVLSKEDYLKIKDFMSTVSSFYKCTVLAPLAASAFMAAAALTGAVGLPVLAIANMILACGIVLTGSAIAFIRSLEIALNF